MTPRPAEETNPLFRKASWLTAFRLAMITVLLGGTTVIDFPWTGELGEGPGPLYALVLATYAASLAFALGLRAGRALTAIAYGQVALDVGIAGVVVLLTGGTDSPFVFMFSLAIVNGSILLYRRGAVFGTVLSLVVYLPIALAHSTGPLHTAIIHAAAFVGTAALASYLAEQLRHTGERLAAREVDLASLSALHGSIVQSLSSGLLTVDEDGRVTFLNRAGEQLTGLELAAVRGKPAATWFSTFEPTTRGETEWTNARGEALRVGYTMFPLTSSTGTPIGRAIIFQDLTHLRAMEAVVQRAERLADLGRVAAGLAHELRNPLASMSGSIELLRSSMAPSGQEARLMDIALREAGRLNELVTRFLGYSRPPPLRREDVDLSGIVAETLEVFAHDPAAARVAIETALDPAPAWCDPDQARQVLWNLLLNAAQACQRDGKGGTVRVQSAVEPSGGARLTVEDDGAGIAAADLEKLFTPFFTTREEGTGLGLATVQRIVDGHGGTVTVDSAPGAGTCFTVRFPARPAERLHAEG